MCGTDGKSAGIADFINMYINFDERSGEAKMKDEILVSEVIEMNAATVEELSNVLIHVVAEGASIGFLSPVEGPEARSYWGNVIEPGVIVFVATQAGEIIGTVQLHLAMKPNAAHRAEIAKLMVHPNYRKRGIARLLMRTAEQRAITEGRTLLVLDTRAGDPSNLLYQSMGYTEAGLIPNYAQSSNGSLDATVLYFKELAQGIRL